MAFDGYFSFGGNEIVNNERAAGYSRSAECPLPQLRAVCAALPDALGDPSYNAQQMETAPWFDSAVPESSRFYGLYALEVKDMNTSTRSVALAEGIDDGGVLGRSRKGPKAVRVKAMLVAKGQDALDYGHAWLNSALDPNACGQHGSGCGTSDLRFFSSCPPERQMVSYYTDWTAQQTNLLTNPSGEAAGSAVVVRTNLNPNPRMYPAVTSWSTTGPTATLTATANGAQVDIVTGPTTSPLVFNSADLAIANGDRASASIEVTVPAGFPAMPLKLDVYAYGQNAAIATSGSVTVQPGTTVTLVAASTQAATAAVTGMRMIVYGGTGGAPTGGRAVFRNALIEKTAVLGPYFDGGAQPIVRTNWIRNSSFETDASLWTVTNAASISRVTTQAHRGSASLRVITGGTTSGEGVYSSTYTVPGVYQGMPYAAGIWVLAPAGATMEALANTLGTGGTVPTVAFTGTGSWQYVAMPNNLSSSGITPYIIVRTRGTAQAITFYIDEAILETGVSSVGAYFDTANAPQGFVTGWAGAANASATLMWDADFSTRWQGTANASASELTGVAAPSVTLAGAGALPVIRSSRFAVEGSYSFRAVGGAVPPVGAYFEFSGMVAGQTYTNIITAYSVATMPGTAQLRQLTVRCYSSTVPIINGPSAGSAASQTELRHTFTVPADTSEARMRVYLTNAAAGTVIPDTWWDLAAVVPGTYTGPAFTGRSTPANPDLERYRWTGAADASTSVYETRQILQRPQTDEEYALDWKPAVRYLHDVATTSGPIERDIMNSGEWWAQVVEWTWTSERPWIYGEPKLVDLPTTPSFVVEDVRYNLVKFPSMQLTNDTLMLIGQNYSTNPSVETNATGWSFNQSGAITAAQVAGARSTELAAVGGASYKVTFTSTVTGSGTISAVQTVALPAAAPLPAVYRFSVNMWSAAVITTGTPTLSTIAFSVDWLNASNTVLRTDALGTAPAAGGFVTVPNILPPTGATQARVSSTVTISSIANGNVVSLFADALAVTIP